MDVQNSLKNTLSCIVPVHNEAKHLTAFIQSLRVQLTTLDKSFEIIFVDDGSTDASSEIIQQCQFSEVKLIQFSRNFGKEAALYAGLSHATGDAIVMLDSDFQHPPALINEFVSAWEAGYNMVYGIRKNREEQGIIKGNLSKLFYQLLRSSSKIDIPANASDFRLIDKQVKDALLSCQEHNLFLKGLYAWVGFKSKGIEYTASDRASGTSQMRFKDLTELAITGITSFSDLPLRIWSLIGVLISSLSLVYALFMIIKTAMFGVDVPGFATLIVAIIFFGGIQLISVGILGEYLAKVFTEVKKRPHFIVSKYTGFIDKQD